MERVWEPHPKHTSFETVGCTAIVSDIHLCEAEPPHPKYPLWKKYKTRQFFFDKTFVDFLFEIHEKSKGQSLELILNGDTFDFDSVTALPAEPHFQVNWIEQTRGLNSQCEKSVFKMQRILEDHHDWVNGMKWFLAQGHRVVFVVGNHDIELMWPDVQRMIRFKLEAMGEHYEQVRFCEFFYISNKDTLIEHGHQYDPYCRADDPLFPFVLRYNRLQIKIPFGNLASRYMINAMGFFNPYIESNYIMTIKEYVKFFFKYIVRAQPLLILTWLWGASLTLIHTLKDRLQPPFKNPMISEDFIEDVAFKANATPRMVRELKELAVPSAAGSPIKIARELWLDRAFLVFCILVGSFQIFLFIKQIFEISLFWMFIPIFLLIPFFVFYARSIESKVQSYKEPKERVLVTAGFVTQAKRIIYGHTHIVRHEIIGTVEHLNSGTWSPAFKDVECEQQYDQKTFIWIEPQEGFMFRRAEVYQMRDTHAETFFKGKRDELGDRLNAAKKPA